jgi:apolipoprotein N-acyltransferase
MSANNNKQFLVNQMMWMGISFGISIVISMLVPFPISLVIIMGVFILLNLYMRNRMMRRMGSGMLVGSMSSSSSGQFGKILLYELRIAAQPSSLS